MQIRKCIPIPKKEEKKGKYTENKVYLWTPRKSNFTGNDKLFNLNIRARFSLKFNMKNLF